LNRLVTEHIQWRHSQCFKSLAGLPVTVTLFDEIRVGFKLAFDYDESRTLGGKDFTGVCGTIKWLGDQTNELKAVAQRLGELDDKGSR
jgi:hypothetical protein